MSSALSAFPRRLAFSPWWIALAAVFLLLDAGLLRLFAFGADWAPLWVAGRQAWTDAARVYDFDLMTSLQAPLLGHVDHRPFIYPPSALLIVAPLALLPFQASLFAVSAGSLALLAWAARPFGGDRALLLIAPPVLLCAIAGQPSLAVGALAAAAVTRLGSRDLVAGLLLGVAAAIKPTLFLLAPIALLSGGHWRALLWSGVTAAAIALISGAVFGFGTWALWLGALPGFQQLVLGEPSLLSSTITPYATAVRFGVDPRIAMLAAALVALPVVGFVFARTRDCGARLVALLGGGLLIAPYSMNYELALLAPAVLSARLTEPRRLVLPTVWAASLCSGASLLGLLAVYAWIPVRRMLRDDGCVEPGVHVRA